MAGDGTTVRDHPYRGGSRLAVPFPGTSAEPAEHHDEPAAEPDDQADDVDEPDEPAAAPSSRRRSGGGRSSSLLSPPGSGDLSGALFAVIAWSWIVLPLVQGGPARVRDVWRAKWLNKGPDGKRLA